MMGNTSQNAPAVAWPGDHLKEFTMIRKILLATLVAAIGLGAATTAMAQLGDVRGHVYLKKADGTKAPVEGAVIDFYRTDIAGKAQVKSKKDGSFVHAGLLFVGTYTIAVSAPGATPRTRSGIRPGRGQDIDFELDPGDGRVPTEAEVKAADTGSAATANETAEQKAAREANEAKLAALKASNAKAESSNAIVTTSFKEGNEFIVAGREAGRSNQYATAITKYDQAVAKFDAGLAADPDHPGAPALLTNKSLALTERGKNHYNVSVTSKDDPEKQKAERELSKQDVLAAAEAGNKAVSILQSASADVKASPNYPSQLLAALSARARAYPFLIEKVDPTKVADAEKAFNEYIAAETKPEGKEIAEMELAKVYFDGGEYGKAIVKYQEILAAKPDNIEALYGMGLAMVNVGEGASDKAKIQEGLGFLQSFVEKVPETDPRKGEMQGVITEYKNSQNLKPQKPASTRRRGN
jgi:tetratricopeptide (TPR) repeat protein